MRGWRTGLGAILLGFVAAGVSGCGQSATAPGDGSGLLAMQEILLYRSTASGYVQPARLVVTDEAAWAAEWARIHTSVSPQPPLPEVDFSASVVVIAAMGLRSSGGHEVIVERVRAHDGVLFVDVMERTPGSRCFTTAALTSPVHAVQVPRAATTASFSIRRETFEC